MPLLSRVSYASILQYSVRGTTEYSARTKKACHAIKLRAHPGYLEKSIGIIKRLVAEGHATAAYLGEGVVLVPAPGHAPLTKRDQALWVPKIICKEMVDAGLASSVEPCIERRRAVAKSATAGRHAKRDALVHYQSIRVTGIQFDNPHRITVVDDVVTTGATLLACASRLQGAFPNSEVRCFGLLRPVSDGEVEHIVSPHTGTITLQPSNSTFRS